MTNPHCLVSLVCSLCSPFLFADDCFCHAECHNGEKNGEDAGDDAVVHESGCGGTGPLADTAVPAALATGLAGFCILVVGIRDA